VDFDHRGHEGHKGKPKDGENDFTRTVIGCALKVHSALGPGLLESIYEECLCHELDKSGVRFQRQVECPIRYDNRLLANALRLDLLVEQGVIVEVKAVDELRRIHEAQLLTYLKLTGVRLGLLLNFNTVHFRDGIRRRAL
jgi:GxxExxY protein